MGATWIKNGVFGIKTLATLLMRITVIGDQLKEGGWVVVTVKFTFSTSINDADQTKLVKHEFTLDRCKISKVFYNFAFTKTSLIFK